MEWKEVRLGDILNFHRGHDLPREKMEFGEVPVAASNGIIGYHNVATDISPCITIGRSGNIGTPYIYKKCWAHNTTLYIDNFKGNDPLYLYYLCKTIPFKSFVGGSAVPTLNRNHIHPIMVKYIPNLSDQRKIAGILSALDAKIENNNKINANLEAQAEALFKSWFVDFTPFKDQPFVDSELGPIPQGWKVGKINEFVDVIYGAPYKSKLFNTQKEGLPLIRIRDLKTCSPQFYTKELLPNTELVNYGDVVAGMDAEFTPHIWLGETGLLNQRVCKFKPHTGISPLYSMLMIKPKLEFAQNYKVGTTVSHLGKSDIDKFIVIVPPLDIVKEVSSIFDAVLNEQIYLAKENQRLAALRDTLLPKLMSGEIKL
ncbi:MAG: restriction endonuclease subunit S [Sodaliphilus sp.]|nr:restriction endonuclease subunit S [Sodaliphilus sp.]